MPSRTECKAWDLSSPVSDLLQSLTISDPPKHESSIAPKGQPPVGSDAPGFGTLGDFTKIFQFLGTSLDAPSPKPSLHPAATAEDEPLDTPSVRKIGLHSAALEEQEQERVPLPFEEKKDYTSDGAVYRPPTSKGVRFCDWYGDDDSEELHRTRSLDSGEDTTSTAPDASADVSGGRSKTTKNKEKKARKKANKRARAAAAAIVQTKATSDVESTGKSIHSPSKSPARKASVHTVVAEPVTSPPVFDTKSKSKKKKSKAKGEPSTSDELKAELEALHEDIVAEEAPTDSRCSKSDSDQKGPTTRSQARTSRTKLLPPVTPDRPILQRATASERPVPRPSFQPNFQSFSLTPASIQPPPPTQPYVVNPEFYAASPFQQGGRPQLQHIYQQNAPKAPPFTIRRGTDRHEHFFLELLKQFPHDKKWLLSPANMSNHSTNPDGIHVFVDASNIFIGFYEHLKKLFGLRQGRIEGLQISFDALVLLLERRRPVAKRVVVGSEPHLPAFEMAKAIGYETSILSQVYKDHELSKRQRRLYYQGASNGQNGNNHGGYANAAHAPEMVSGDVNGESPPPLPSPTRPGDPLKWVEQGVDELLHLKMLESIVDADSPGTMVLATGDAAVAEYSQGFLKMVERALNKGWSVELIAWGISINKAYRAPAFRKKWGEKFRIVELDDFAEDLIDT